MTQKRNTFLLLLQMKASVSILGKGKGFYNGKRGFVFSVCLPFLADCIFVSRSEKGNSSCPSLLLYLSGICFFSRQAAILYV
jgi:hypothetical protein